ncbi:MAG TPA: hypothetical protein VGZ01_06200 [Trinickia sp.]|nr:hypothetical protein [Trinickia sp.]
MNATPFTIAPALAHATRGESAFAHWGTDVKRILCVRDATVPAHMPS